MSAESKPPLELTFLGSGNAFAGDRYWSSFVVNRRYLFDAPPTVLPHLNKLGIPTTSIATIFISHFHADHFFGLPFLYLDYEYLTFRKDELVVVGPRGTKEMVEQLAELGYGGLTPDGGLYQRTYMEVDPGDEGVACNAPFKAVEVEQSMRLACLGFKVDIGGRVVSYTGDTVMCDGVRELADGADVLVIDCSCWDEPCDHHMGLADIQRFRRDVPPETTFVITHLDAGRRDVGMEGILVAEDFGVIRL